MPKLGRGPVGFVWCLHRRFDKAREKGRKAGVHLFERMFWLRIVICSRENPHRGLEERGVVPKGTRSENQGETRQPGRAWRRLRVRVLRFRGMRVVPWNESYLVDPASSHMLVSKIKPCMSKYKLIILWNCEWLIKSVIVYLMVLLLG